MKISKATKVGVLVFVAFAMLVWGVTFLKGKNFFKKENHYYVIYNRIDGLSESSSIMLNGFKIGQVRDISFMPNQKSIIVSFAIGDEFILPDSTVARIFSSDLMGTKSIEIIYGKSSKNHLPGDTLFAVIEESLKDQVSLQMLPLKVKAEGLMSSIDSVLAVVQYIFNEGTRDNISKAFVSVKMTLENLEHASVSLDTLLRNEKGKLARIFTNVEHITLNLKNNNEQLTNIINNFSSISDSLARADIASTITNANKVISDIDNILAKVNSGQGSIGMLVNNDTLYNNLENATFHLDRLLEDMQKNPKKYVHFSLFDFGRTIEVVETSKKQEKIQEKN
ncbi:MAG: hypothetical protein A2W98_14175 [Bacteroidetes bacterium GWF2_33_38]|nr:MAG: hypothetical protein A2W98_14175 [Bacteroidetes bacterium GWF2_33_38]OFY76520.1 MAG: hypothetical protein A2265_09850 [Bacteroidetes bacterium RIFOXYA12_FULL_33_9]OFY85349.1 MAG: hypothetical protein A2236_06895 [Bacteroidetes bacterium RIFOXYA2_FULL_33_7]